MNAHMKMHQETSTKNVPWALNHNGTKPGKSSNAPSQENGEVNWNIHITAYYIDPKINELQLRVPHNIHESQEHNFEAEENIAVDYIQYGASFVNLKPKMKQYIPQGYILM